RTTATRPPPFEPGRDNSHAPDVNPGRTALAIVANLEGAAAHGEGTDALLDRDPRRGIGRHVALVREDERSAKRLSRLHADAGQPGRVHRAEHPDEAAVEADPSPGQSLVSRVLASEIPAPDRVAAREELSLYTVPVRPGLGQLDLRQEQR